MYTSAKIALASSVKNNRGEENHSRRFVLQLETLEWKGSKYVSETRYQAFMIEPYVAPTVFLDSTRPVMYPWTQYPQRPRPGLPAC